MLRETVPGTLLEKLTEMLPERLLDKHSGRLPERFPGRHPERFSCNCFTKLPESFPEKLPGRVPERFPERALEASWEGSQKVSQGSKSVERTSKQGLCSHRRGESLQERVPGGMACSCISQSLIERHWWRKSAVRINFVFCSPIITLPNPTITSCIIQKQMEGSRPL